MLHRSDAVILEPEANMGGKMKTEKGGLGEDHVVTIKNRYVVDSISRYTTVSFMDTVGGK